MEKEKTFFDKTVNIRAALLLLSQKVRTEQDLQTLMEASKELSNLCTNPHINFNSK